MQQWKPQSCLKIEMISFKGYCFVKAGPGGGIEARPGTEKPCSHNLQSGPVKTWTAVFVIINISDRHGST